MQVDSKLFAIAAVAVLGLTGTPMLTSAYYHSGGYGSAGGEKQQAMSSGTEADVVIEATSARDFEPQKTVIKVGDTVEWRNASSLPHTVTADPARAAGNLVALPEGARPFRERLSAGESFRHTFKQPGSYRYVCEFHGEMRGMVEVKS